jgi:hypothetical protein
MTIQWDATHQSSNPGAHIFFLIYFGIFQRYALSDVPVDDEAPAETSKIFISVGAQSFGGAHRGGVCVRVFIGVSGVRVVSVCVVLCNSKKT